MIMRIRVSHTTSYCYDTPPTSVTQILRLTPRNHNGQYVVGWRIELSEDCLLHKHEDAFGNITHSFTAEGPYNGLSIAVEGEVDTHDTNSVVRGAIERFCGILVRDGLVMIADTRTNAGLDNVSTFRKLHVYTEPGERIMALASSGNLSLS